MQSAYDYSVAMSHQVPFTYEDLDMYTSSMITGPHQYYVHEPCVQAHQLHYNVDFDFDSVPYGAPSVGPLSQDWAPELTSLDLPPFFEDFERFIDSAYAQLQAPDHEAPPRPARSTIDLPPALSPPVSGQGSSTRPPKGSRTAHARPAPTSPVDADLQPIQVSSPNDTYPCPIPGCGAALAYKDSAWRRHFKTVHHAALCSTCPASGAGSPCMARCPVPGCPDAHGASGGRRRSEDGTMTLDSLGRHWLNVHIGVVFRCPLCGHEGMMRESAATRHVRSCAQRRRAGGTRAATH
ncbi:uncharacterized protein BXZ73DRAFT_74897 [Epithele typhae]|uniref:uncharacterized protein n=1 Tax=Epithele typhae TaxID=378194 RepID=UPI0020075275|nr:uncharacterized protein BXZ73DRAFT_74897 [Epithele typhae]KAH9941702.1 hypothetical protein BXZ73DRAFT_74897 [Epithele typhae]